MQRNKYLEDLGIPLVKIGTNFRDDNDDEQWKKERELYGFDSRETWSLDKIFVEWLYSHLMMFVKDCDEVIDLDYYKFEFEGREYSQREAIDYILQACKNYLIWENLEEEEQRVKDLQSAVRLFAEILPAMWW